MSATPAMPRPARHLTAAATQSLPVYPAWQVRVIDGANLGDPVAPADEMMPGDSYMLTRDAMRTRLTVVIRPEDDSMRITADSEAGRPGAQLCFDCCATFMSPDGVTLEALILVELCQDGTIAGIWFMPLAEPLPKQGYALVAIDRMSARRRLAESACVSFTCGTRITMASGAQVPVEELRVGDRVLTRDHGPQAIHWIGQQTMRASGAFAPVRIKAGALHNAGDLVVSPDNRLFVYQRRDALGAGRAEVLVRARHLLNGTTVTRTEGGFVDYFQLLFDRYEIIYAEGIAAESFMVDTRVRPALPRALRERFNQVDQGLLDRQNVGLDLPEEMLDGERAAEILRGASAC